MPAVRSALREALTRNQMEGLVRMASLAPSTRNTQPWRFVVDADGVRLYADLTRWQRVADPDRRELYLSLGCALENLVTAAAHEGLVAHVERFPSAGDPLLVARVTFEPSHLPTAVEDDLAEAIALRHTAHEAFDRRPVPPEALAALARCAPPGGPTLVLTTDAAVRDAAERLQLEADAVLFGNPAWRRELAMLVGEGVFGTPWLFAQLGRLAMAYLDLGGVAGKRDAALIHSAPVLGVICTKEATPEAQVRAGELLERVWLRATTLGLALQPVSHAVQVPEIAARLRALLPPDAGIPQQPFRLGYLEAAERESPPRRPLEEIVR